MLPPPALKSTFGKTKIKEAFQGKFSTPINSVLRFLPMPLWDKLVLESNQFALQTIAKQGHHRITNLKWRELDIQEFMTFLGS